MKRKFVGKNDLEKEICEYSSTEGLGSVYERIMVKRFFEKLVRAYSFSSVLEYSNLSITKGLDNVVFIMAGKKVTISDHKATQYKNKWPYQRKPVFSEDGKLKGKFNLVWNFGLTQLQPEILDIMMGRSNKFLLLFVPNWANYGMPIHYLYHKLTKTTCNHPERGIVKLRSLNGIKKLVSNKGIKVIKAGYIDIPLIPDIGFSLRELELTTGIRWGNRQDGTIDPTETLRIVKKLSFFENKSLPAIIKQFFAHHIYVFGKIA